FEITRDYNSVLPLMLVSVIADGVAVRLMPKTSIMTEKLARRGVRIHQDYGAGVRRGLGGAESMDAQVATVSSDTMVREVADGIARRDPRYCRHQGMVVVDKDGKLVGVITMGDILRIQEEDSENTTVLEIASREVRVAYPDETLHEAAE